MLFPKRKEVRKKLTDEERYAIIEAAKKLGIEVEGRDLNEIAQDIVKATSKSEKE